MCNCNKVISKPKNYISQTRVIIRQLWETTKMEKKSITVKKINKT